MTPSQRHVSGTYLATQTRPYDLGLDALPVQGHLDTCVPSHIVDLDTIRRAGIVPPPPRVVRHRRVTTLGRAVWWAVERIPAAVVIALAILLTYALIREMTP